MGWVLGKKHHDAATLLGLDVCKEHMVKTSGLYINVDMTVICSVWCQGGSEVVQDQLSFCVYHFGFLQSAAAKGSCPDMTTI